MVTKKDVDSVKDPILTGATRNELTMEQYLLDTTHLLNRRGALAKRQDGQAPDAFQRPVFVPHSLTTWLHTSLHRGLLHQ